MTEAISTGSRTRTASTPLQGARRGTVIGVLSAVAAAAASGAAPEGTKEAAGAAAAAATGSLLTWLGKTARDRQSHGVLGGLWGALFGWLV